MKDKKTEKSNRKINLKKFYSKQIANGIWLAIISVFVLSAAGFATYKILELRANQDQLILEKSALETTLAYAEESRITQTSDLELQNAAIQEELNQILSIYEESKSEEFTNFSEHALTYVTTKTRINDYKNKSIDVGTTEEDLTTLYDTLLAENYDEFDAKFEEMDSYLEEKYNAYIAAIAAARAAAPKTTTPTTSTPTTSTSYGTVSRNQYSSYEQKYVTTEIGSFWADVITIDLSNPNLRIITETEDERDNCWDTGCGANTLSNYVSRNGGFAGIHGSYFCPPDYSACTSIPYSFDLATYNSRVGKWINPYLKYKGLMTFNGRTPSFYYGQEDTILQNITVTAGIANHPPLLYNGTLVYSGLDSKQANVKSYRGGIGYSGNTLYLVIARSATVPDLAYVMKALGASYALNLDGGGSSAMYYDGYKVGPGRLLPNAIVFAE